MPRPFLVGFKEEANVAQKKGAGSEAGGGSVHAAYEGQAGTGGQSKVHRCRGPGARLPQSGAGSLKRTARDTFLCVYGRK